MPRSPASSRRPTSHPGPASLPGRRPNRTGFDAIHELSNRQAKQDPGQAASRHDPRNSACDHLSRHSLTNAARSLRKILAASAFLEHSNSLICSARRFSATARYSGATVLGSTSFSAKLTAGHPAKIMPRAKADLTDHLRTNTAATPEILVTTHIGFY